MVAVAWDHHLMGAYDSIDAHVDHCQIRNLRPTTLRTRRGVLELLARHIGHDPVDATPGELVAWQQARSREVKPQTLAAQLVHIRGFYRWAVLEGLRVDDPSIRLVRPKIPAGLPRPIDERRLAVALADAPRPVLDWLTLAGYAGLRACEIAPLCGEDYDGERLMIRDGKGGKDRIVPAHPRVQKLAVNWPTAGPLWSLWERRPVTALRVSHRACRWLHACGFDDTLHSLRHRFGTQTYRATLDVRATQELLGHASLVTTQRYVQTASGAMQAAVLALD